MVVLGDQLGCQALQFFRGCRCDDPSECVLIRDRACPLRRERRAAPFGMVRFPMKVGDPYTQHFGEFTERTALRLPPTEFDLADSVLADAGLVG